MDQRPGRAAGWFACLDVAGRRAHATARRPPRSFPGPRSARRRSVVVEQRRRRRLLRRGRRRAARAAPRRRATARSLSTAWTARQRDLVAVAQQQRRPRRLPLEAHRAHRRPRQLVRDRRVADPDARRRRRRPATGPAAASPAPITSPSPTIATWSTVPKRTTPVDDDCRVSATTAIATTTTAAATAQSQPHAPRDGRDGGGGTAESVTPPWSQHVAGAAGRVRGRGDHRTAQHEAWQARALPPVEQLRAGPLVDPGADAAARCATSASTPSPSTAAASG